MKTDGKQYDSESLKVMIAAIDLHVYARSVDEEKVCIIQAGRIVQELCSK